MAEKRDYYDALGIAKTATAEEIKSACKRKVMLNHPDRIKNNKALNDKQREEAAEVYTLALEAEKVLLDPVKKQIYDTQGHKGLEKASSGSNVATSGITDMPVIKRTFSTEDTFEFFDKAKAKHDKNKTDSNADDGLTSEERRQRAREERLKSRQQPAGSTTPSVTSAPITTDFNDVSENVKNAAEKLRDMTADPSGSVSIPMDVLLDFKTALDGLSVEIDKAIRAKKNNDFKP